MRLEKYQGLGNDFLVLVDPEASRPIDADMARAVCDRRRGAGAAGRIRATPGAAAGDTMELRNADGGAAEMSGNGIRCMARALRDAGLVRSPRVAIGTAAGRRTVTFGDGDLSSVDMGSARVGEEQLGVLAGWQARAVDVGNPHLVLLGPDAGGVDLAEVGPKVAAGHPGGVNVELVTPGPGAHEVTMRVWERGVGETEACGTGAVAAAAAAHAWGLVGPRVVVHQPGGDLEVELGDPVVLTGPAVHVCTIELPCP